MPRKLWILSVLAILLIAGCTQSQPVCNKPYILVGRDCCLDQNGNAICDEDEAQKPETPTTPIAEDKLSCSSDSDCAPAQCCHPTDVINKKYAPDCGGAICSQVCQGPLDCNAGEPACINGKCSISKSSPLAGLSIQPKVPATPPSCCNHPYYHSVWRATSKDGKSWTKEGGKLIDHASVPHPAVLPNGDIVVYYVNGSIDTFDCSITSDGLNFRYGDCKLYGFNEQKSWDPYVRKLDSGKYRLFFFGPGDKPPGPGDSAKMYSAVSDDGINFVMEEGVRFQEKAEPGSMGPSVITDPAFILDGSVWRLYMAKGLNVLAATSTDGNTFTKVGEYDTKGSVPDILKLDDGSLLLFVCSQGISYMTPPEISGSVKILGTAIQPEMGTIICDPGIIRLSDGTYVMYYKKQEAKPP